MNVSAQKSGRAVFEAEFRLSDPVFMTEELRMLRDQVRRFVDTEVVPHAEAWEAAGPIAGELLESMGDRGGLGRGNAPDVS